MRFTPEMFNAVTKDRFQGLVGITFTSIEPGRTMAHIDVHEGLHHPGGVVHGGVPYTLADTCMAIALMAGLEDGHDCATIEMKMTYLKAVREGQLECTAEVIKRGRRIAMLEAEVRNGPDVVAKASGSFYIIAPGG